MSTINNFNELSDMIDNSNIISKDATNMLLELDILPSVTTQAALNKWLVSLGKRIQNQCNIVIEAIKSGNITLGEYENWLSNNFTNYSYSLYKNSMK